MTIHILHPDGTRVPLLGMRNTRTGELRPATAAELAALKVDREKVGVWRVEFRRSER